MRPQTFVVVAVGSATLLVAGAEMARGSMPRLRVFIGGTIAAFTLAALAGVVPALATALAGLAILGAVLTSGYDLARPLASAIAK